MKISITSPSMHVGGDDTRTTSEIIDYLRKIAHTLNELAEKVDHLEHELSQR